MIREFNYPTTNIFLNRNIDHLVRFPLKTYGSCLRGAGTDIGIPEGSVHACVYLYAYACICSYVYMWACMCVQVHVNVCACVSLCNVFRSSCLCRPPRQWSGTHCPHGLAPACSPLSWSYTMAMSCGPSIACLLPSLF